MTDGYAKYGSGWDRVNLLNQILCISKMESQQSTGLFLIIQLALPILHKRALSCPEPEHSLITTK